MSDPLIASVPLSSSQIMCGEVIAEPVSRPPLSSSRWTEWDRFVEASPQTGFMQSSWWVDFRYHFGFENFGITLAGGDQIAGGAVVLKFSYAPDGCFYYIQDGPVLPDDPQAAEEVFNAICNELEERRTTEKQTVSHLRIEPRWQTLPRFVSGFRAIAPRTDGYLEPRDTRCIDLRPSEAAILAQMKPKGRYNIGVAHRHGVSVVEDTTEQGLADFLSIYNDTASRQRMQAKPPRYFRLLLSLTRPKRSASLFFAEYQGLRIATALVLYFGHTATYFYGGSLDLHRPVMAPYLLHFEIMRKAKGLGHEWYDLWGIAPPNEPNHRWSGFTAFKAKFGGAEVHLVPTLDYVYDDAGYEHYVGVR